MRRALLILFLASAVPALVFVVTASPAAAQLQARPTDPPLVNASNEQWYQLREPLLLAGESYFPAGAQRFFDGNTMVRSGHYNGVPIYSDTTLEPYSVVFVPIGRGMMQPYERLRRGDLAGTTGSRTPSFPVAAPSASTSLPPAPSPPTGLPLPVGAIGAYTPDEAPRPTATAGRISEPEARRYLPAQPPLASLPRARSNDGVWIRFMGEKWVSAGVAVPFTADAFVQVGEYATFPVFARAGLKEDVVYLPTREGLVAPYRLKE